MKRMLDTNMCIYVIKKHPAGVVRRFRSFQMGHLCLSSVTLAELSYGVQKSQHREKNQKALDQFVFPFEVIWFDDQAAQHYGQIRADLERRGCPIGSMDILIAAHARSLGVALVTHHEREFSRVPGLEVENWVEEGRSYEVDFS